MQEWWNDNDRGKSKYAEKNLSHYHFVDLKSHINRSGIKASEQQSVYSSTIIPWVRP